MLLTRSAKKVTLFHQPGLGLGGGLCGSRAERLRSYGTFEDHLLGRQAAVEKLGRRLG